jgi:hypothetical protein
MAMTRIYNILITLFAFLGRKLGRKSSLPGICGGWCNVMPFSGSAQLVDPAVEEAIRAAQAPFVDSDEVPPPEGTAPRNDM